MLVLITYDVSVITADGRRRLRNIAKICLDYGMRVQNSVFECEIDPAQLVNLKRQLTEIFNPNEDSLRFYFLGSNWKHRVEHIGAKKSIDQDGPLIV